MKYYELELGDKTYKLRLTSSNAIAMEEKTNKPMLEIIQDYSITNIIKLLEYMCKDSEHNFGKKEASEFYDLLVDNGYTMQDIVFKVIYECLVVSGFLTHKELEEMTKIAPNQ